MFRSNNCSFITGPNIKHLSTFRYDPDSYMLFFIRNWCVRNWGYRVQNLKKLKGCITLRNWSVVNSRNCIFGVHKNTISEQILRLKCLNSYIEVSLSIIFNFICLSAICYAMKLGMDIIQGQCLSLYHCELRNC